LAVLIFELVSPGEDFSLSLEIGNID